MLKKSLTGHGEEGGTRTRRKCARPPGETALAVESVRKRRPSGETPWAERGAARSSAKSMEMWDMNTYTWLEQAHL